MLEIKTLLHPTDFSKHSAGAFELTCALAREQGARVVVLHVGDRDGLAFGDASSPPVAADAEAEMERRFGNLKANAGLEQVDFVWRGGNPAEEICALAQEQGADLIVMGTHGRGGLRKLIMGSIAAEVVASAPCAVLTYRSAPSAQ